MACATHGEQGPLTLNQGANGTKPCRARKLAKLNVILTCHCTAGYCELVAVDWGRCHANGAIRTAKGAHREAHRLSQVAIPLFESGSTLWSNQSDCHWHSESLMGA